MDYEKKYKEALERARAINNGKDVDVKAGTTTCEYIFPELAESKDERIIKAIKSAVLQLTDIYLQEKYGLKQSDCIAWLEKRGKQKQLYIRFGEIPTDEKSKIYHGEVEVDTENGVSVYPAFKTDEGDIVLGLTLPITKTTLYTQQHLLEYDNRPCYLVSGDYIGKDTDGQPLINNVSIIKKIDNYRVKEENQTEQEKDILEDAILDGYILDGNEDGLIAETIRYKKEKQAEQNQTDKVKPKFKVGDWIINPRTGLIKHIKNVLLCDNNGNYEFESSSMSIDSVDNSFHLWTIQDAKDGDVLTNGKMVVIFKHFEEPSYRQHIVAYIGLDRGGDIQITDDTWRLGIDKAKPATKEQRDLLFQKMHEAGYEWDARNKVMTKIEQKPADSYCQENCNGFQETGKCFADGECKTKREAEQNSTWSEEDERMFDYALDMIEWYSGKNEDKSRLVSNWLKSLKGRVQKEE